VFPSQRGSLLMNCPPVRREGICRITSAVKKDDIMFFFAPSRRKSLQDFSHRSRSQGETFDNFNLPSLDGRGKGRVSGGLFFHLPRQLRHLYICAVQFCPDEHGVEKLGTEKV
jgi:hypothetical protein